MDEVKIPAKVRRELEEAISMQARAKAMEKEAKDLSGGAKAIILPIMSAYGLKSYTIDGVGTSTAKVNSGSSINREKLTEQLLLNGMDLKTVGKIITKSSTTWSTEYVEFKEAR